MNYSGIMQSCNLLLSTLAHSSIFAFAYCVIILSFLTLSISSAMLSHNIHTEIISGPAELHPNTLVGNTGRYEAHRHCLEWRDIPTHGCKQVYTTEKKNKMSHLTIKNPVIMGPEWRKPFGSRLY